MNTIQILDVTLRDGEQTRGVVFTPDEKLNIAKYLLLNAKVPRVEIASARVSEGERFSVSNIVKWAKTEGLENRLEMLGFVDHKLTVDWMDSAGCKYLNLLTKGSERHTRLQLHKTLEEHLADIQKTVEYADSKGFYVSVYLEDWSNGFLHSPEHVLGMVDGLSKMPVKRIYLADTLGILSPDETFEGVNHVRSRFPELHFEFHGHNDYSLSVANCMAAAKAGVKGLHVSVNGLGERAGNSPLEAVITALHDKMNIQTGIVEKEITPLSKLVEAFSGKRVSENRPVVGRDVYTQTAGIHADGDKKANLYFNPILPERFGRKRSYALGKLAGKASISENIKELGMVLTPEIEKKVLERVVEMGDSGLTVTKEDLPFIISDISGSGGNFSTELKIESWTVNSAKGVLPTASISVTYKEQNFKETGYGDGGYDAFMDALSKIMKKLNISIPPLVDYQVRIPPGGKTSALVEAVITWQKSNNEDYEDTFRTIGVDPDQIVAAIKATEKMLHYIIR
jgi:(R)-citramalate synthase